MRSLLFSVMIIGLSLTYAAAAFAGEKGQINNMPAAIDSAVVINHANITPVRWYGYPYRYGGYYYPRYGAYYGGYPYGYRTYVAPGYIAEPYYGYSYYSPYDFYYSGPRVAFRFRY
jgi:hypothetical protein